MNRRIISLIARARRRPAAISQLHRPIWRGRILLLLFSHSAAAPLSIGTFAGTVGAGNGFINDGPARGTPLPALEHRSGN